MFVEAQQILTHLTVDQLRELSKTPVTMPIGGEPFEAEVWEAQSGSIVYTTKVRSRSKQLTYIVQYPETPLGTRQEGISIAEYEALCKQVRAYLRGQELIQVDRQIGQGFRRYLCRLLITKPFARIALMWRNTLCDLETPISQNPDFVSIYVPEWPERKIVADMKNRVSWILGTDYLGEAKKSFLRQAMYQCKQDGGLGLHAGSKELIVKNRQGALQSVGMILFGLSGTGKTSLTIHNHDLMSPEKVIMRQDDVILMDPDGYCRGTECGFFIKTEGLAPEGQDVLYQAAMAPSATFENVMVRGGQGGPLDFEDVTLTTNGRGVVFRSEVESDPDINLTKAHILIFITRRNDVIPGVARLTPEQAGLAFMLGESIETSAGDPKKAGQPKRSVGTNPFIVGHEAEEGNRMMAILRANPDMEAYLLNTGTVGQVKDPDTGAIVQAGHKVTITESATILREIARGTIEWQADSVSGYEVPTAVPGIDWSLLDPQTYFDTNEYHRRFEVLRTERREWLHQFPGLVPEIEQALAGG
jgi:phosphoenolpyruvate carboxykinase (ATP)